MAGTQNQPAEYEQVSYNSPDGAQFGRLSSEPIALWGGTPTARTWSSAPNISTTASISTAGVYGVATSTEMLQITVGLSTAIMALKALGAM